MGYNQRGKPWEHITEAMAILLVGDFEWWNWIFKFGWKRYVYSDHVKVIVEQAPCGYYFVRSIFRSKQQFLYPGELSKTDFVLGYIIIKNPDTGNFEVLNSTEVLTMQEYRLVYQQCGGTANW